MTDVDVVLSRGEAVVLADCEERIERGMKTFVEVGSALAMIRDNRLYRAEFETFESYCAGRWGFTDSRARQLIIAAATVTNVTAAGLPTPTNEGQARELARVPEEQRAEVWTETVERTDGKPTAAAIRETAASKTPVRRDPERSDPHRFAPVVATPVEPDQPEEVAPTVGGLGDGATSSTEPPAGPATAVHSGRPGPDDEDARRDAELAAELADTATRFRANFAATVARADDLWQFDVDRIAEVHALDFDRVVRPFLEEMTRWCDRVQQARRRQASGLRVVNGGAR